MRSTVWYLLHKAIQIQKTVKNSKLKIRYRKAKSQTPPPLVISPASSVTSSTRAHLKRNVKRSEDVERLLKGKSDDEIEGFFDDMDQDEPEAKKRPAKKSNDERKKEVKVGEQKGVDGQDGKNLQQLECRPSEMILALEELMVEMSEIDQENDLYLNGKNLDLEAFYRIHLQLYDSLLPTAKAGKVKISFRVIQNGSKDYPLLNRLQGINGMKPDKPSVIWNRDEVKKFIFFMTNNFQLAQFFKDLEIDGSALLSLTKQDLMTYLKLQEKSADFLVKTIQQLKQETIQKFIQISDLPENKWEVNSL